MRGTRNEYYHKLLKSYRWQRTRLAYLASHPLCEDCARQGRTRAAEEVHHITPVESVEDRAEMARLAFNRHNLMALCGECHRARHDRARIMAASVTSPARLEARIKAEGFIDRPKDYEGGGFF